MNSQFADAVPDRFGIAEVAKRHPVNPSCNPGSGAVVTKLRHPVRESGCFANFSQEEVYPIRYISSSSSLHRGPSIH